jgi:hypothetical protein
MDLISQPVLLLALAIFLATAIERLLELVKAIHNFLAARNNERSMQYWNERARIAREHLEHMLEDAKRSDAPVDRVITSVAQRFIKPGTAGDMGLIMIDATLVRNFSITLTYKILGLFLGIVFACIFSVDIFAFVKDSLNSCGDHKCPSHWWGVLGTGLAMGLGAGPVHKIIVALERARSTRK